MSLLHVPPDILVWQQELGLLPVPLRDVEGEQQYILLNGSSGNFCLDLSTSTPDLASRNVAWSSDVDHYVALLGDYVEVQRWDKNASNIERYSASSVFGQLSNFHKYLEKDRAKATASIVPYTLNTFRSLRAMLNDRADGSEALQVFLYLLACVTEGESRENLDIDKWSLHQSVKSLVDAIDDEAWQTLQRSISEGRHLDRLRPDFTLTLRHASGALFQEAHYEVTYVNQLSFPGTLPVLGDIKKSTKSAGVHFTPPALVRTIVEEAISNIVDIETKDSITIFDPACGSGEFLREAIRQLRLRNFTQTIHVIGWDISLAACIMARFSLAWEKMDSHSDIIISIENCDSLARADWPNYVDLLLMNPPFVAWPDMNDEQKSTTLNIIGDHFERRPDLASVFLFRAATCLTEQGIIGTIVPASFLDSYSARKLREYLGNELQPLFIARLGSHMLFPNATVDTAIYLATNTASTRDVPIALWTDHQTTSTSAGLRELRRLRNFGAASDLPRIADGFDIYTQTGIGKTSASWSPRPFKALQIEQRLSETQSRVSDLFNVRMGARTGANNIFVVSEPYYRSLPKREQRFFRPAILNKSIRYGRLNNSLYVFYPYDESKIESESELRRLIPTYYQTNLQHHKASLANRKSIRKSAWWELSEYRAWLLNREPRLVSTYFGSIGSFAYDPEGEYVVVQGMAWLYKKGLLEDVAKSEIAPFELSLAYLAVMNSALFATLLSAYSNNVAGGQWNLSPKFINSLPIPNLVNNAAIDITKNLANIGVQIFNGHMPELTENAAEYEEIVKIVYGVEDII